MTETNRQVLLVDDDPRILSSLKRLLKSEKFNLHTFSRASEAWNFIEEKKGDIDVVISDHKMPGVEGGTFLLALRKDYPNLIRVLLTGEMDTNIAKKFIASGLVFRYLTKPCPSDELLNCIQFSFAFSDLWRENQKLLSRLKEQDGLIQASNEKNLILKDPDVELLSEKYGSLDMYSRQYF